MNTKLHAGAAPVKPTIAPVLDAWRRAAQRQGAHQIHTHRRQANRIDRLGPGDVMRYGVVTYSPGAVRIEYAGRVGFGASLHEAAQRVVTLIEQASRARSLQQRRRGATR